MQNQKETNQDSSSSSSSSATAATTTTTTTTETVIVVKSTEEEEEEEADDDEVEKEKVNSKEKIDKKLNNCVIVDIKDKCDCDCDGGGLLNNNTHNKDGENICRICHLNAAECTTSSSSSDKLDLIKLGCGCKDELGIAHRHCAEAWFKLKGNRCCEICGETAKNITGVGDDRFMEEWNERSDESSANPDLRRGFFRGQPFCNFLMACLVIIFIIPWFFHVNMV